MRSRRLVMSQKALDDLLGIYSYIHVFNPVAARRLLDDINGKIDWIAQAGINGVPRSFIPGLRAFPYRQRCIYFVVTEITMTVIRVLHGHRDISPDDFIESSD